MKPLKLFILSVLLLGFLFSCREKPKNLRVGYIPIAECVQLYVAKDLGYFEKYDVNVELISLAGGANILNALNSNSVDVGFSNVVSLVLHKVQGSDFYSVFGGTIETRYNQNHALLINRSNYSNDLKLTLLNSKIAINTFKNIEELMVLKYLKKNGVDFNSVDKVAIPFPRMLPLLESGDITIASIVEPFITIATRDSSNVIVYLDNHYLSTSPRTLVATYVSSKKTINNKKQMLLGFIKALDDTTDFIKNNESEAREIIGNYTKIPKELLPEIGLSEFQKEIDLVLLESVIKDMINFEYIVEKEAPEAKSFIYKID